ncbi:MAG TPA: DNA translocase FtsK 4TM domain-containing protein [Bacteroidota bacterium]
MDDLRAVLTPKKKQTRRRQLLSFAGILVSFMLLLSLLSYSAEDQAAGDIRVVDLWKVFTNDELIQEKARQTGNILGLLGSLVANTLINSTIGYSILLLPVLGLIWSIALLRRRDTRPLLVMTNYAVALGILFAAICGTIRLSDPEPLLDTEWSGVAGDFLASILTTLIGFVGAYLILIGLFVTVFILLFDIDVVQSYAGLRRGFDGAALWLDKQLAAAARLFRTLKARLIAAKPKVEIRTVAEEFMPPLVKRPVVRESRPEEIASRPAPAAEKPFVPIPQSDLTPPGELQLDIREALEEEEVDFDERKATEEPEEEIDFVPPSVDLLESARAAEQVDESELKANAELLRSKLADFGVDIESVSVTPGPVVTLYELVPATGVKVSRIESLEDDIALAMKAKGIRIIAPIPGKGTVGVEIPNHHPSLVTIRSVINSAKFRDSRAALPLALGKTISGEVFVDDLSRMPHLLIAGATGSGKSVGINTILSSLIYRLHPSDVKFVIIDPKKIELSSYRKLKHHYLAVSPDIEEEIVTAPQNAVLVLKSVELEMERRYDRLAAAGVRNISDYNERVKSGRLHDTEAIKHRKLPYLIVLIDELADLMITAAKEVEEPIARLAQLARAVGIHLVLATQRPSVDVITGVIKANFPARIAYQVATKIDSRTILDMNGAEQLLGNGDMLYFPPGSPKPTRIQNAFISADEVEGITDHIGKQKGYSHPMMLPSAFEKKKIAGSAGDGSRDELFEEAAKIIVRHQQGSVSLLQRRLKVGYSRAARLVDELEAAGIVGPFDGSKARDVLVESEAELDVILRSMA